MTKPHHHHHHTHKKLHHLAGFRKAGYFTLGISIGTICLLLGATIAFELEYKNLIYPGVTIAQINFSGKTKEFVNNYWLTRNAPFQDTSFTFSFEDHIATLSGTELELGFDATLSAIQAISIGRSGSFLTDTFNKYQAFTANIDLKPLFIWNKTKLDETLTSLSQNINIEPENALFEFQNGKVVAFKPAKDGRYVDIQAIKRRFIDQLEVLTSTESPPRDLSFVLHVIPQEPLIKTEQTNHLGIKELVGHGQSFFRGSIPGRIHNVTLAASRINGTLIPAGEIFSFNKTLGDISAATGYKQAYVIKSGRTVLDDGGGVCQVSTTLFRAALNAGLPIIERHAHSYRVGYYEQGDWKPGFDATVYDPSYDLKIKNDTTTPILIQAKTDTQNLELVFKLYGAKDDRTVDISPVRLWDSRPAPPALYQDDPTLPNGVIKQVDWSNAGIKSAFDYTVRRGDEETFKKTFFSDFVPWQAVYLRGTAQ